jgi:hypothetical protein
VARSRGTARTGSASGTMERAFITEAGSITA